MIPNKGRYFYTLSPKLRRPPRPLTDSLYKLNQQKNCETDVGNRSLNLQKRQFQTQEMQVKADKAQLIRLKIELAAAKEQINSLKKTISLANHQSSYQMKSMEEEIHILLEKNKNYQAQTAKLREFIKYKQIQGLSKQSKSLLSFQKLNRQNILNYKQNDPYLRNTNIKKCHQVVLTSKQSSQCQLIRAIGQMYHKITGEKYKSLNQLWRWIKGSIYRLDRLRKWRKEARQVLKTSEEPGRTDLVALLKDAMIFIN